MPSMTREDLYRRAMVVRAKKRLSQNFLVEPTYHKLVSDSLKAGPGDTIVEIGPGLGFLTEHLVTTGARVIAVELDESLAERLGQLAAEHKNLTVVNQDFLKFEPADLAAKNVKVVGNVPYQITSPILVKVLGEIDSPSPWLPYLHSLTMMVQLELARRVTAEPGTKDFGQLTVLANYYAESKFLCKVKAEHFVPKPKVDSAVIQLVKRAEPAVRVKDLHILRKLVASGFKERRKMIRNNLAFLGLPDNELTALLIKHGISPSARAETISLEKFARLADAASEILQ
ncbi:MAG: 16S rRNA (adenine(1518)-N(6)/adenine(1519)-N(6))-dimethyltransferase RsmA [Candidatus Obscuribacterales bacterium]|nr:16S rRNA (adenine(1518)-N(6)/adenine(1519)-N(6))-dimethyltransferase RsmA [Candidatus Obscuribacterales bacterium]